MKIPIDIKVRTERICSDLTHKGSDEVPETDTVSVSGYMKKMKDGIRVDYTEPGEDNSTVTTTICAFDDNTVALCRLGTMNSHMVFADGKSHTCIYDTGFFPLQLRICTKRLENSLTMEGGKLDIDYSVEIVGNLAERNHMTISIAPDRSIIKS